MLKYIVRYRNTPRGPRMTAMTRDDTYEAAVWLARNLVGEGKLYVEVVQYVMVEETVWRGGEDE